MMQTAHIATRSLPGAVVTMNAAFLEEVVPEVPVLLSLLITATLVGLHNTIHSNMQRLFCLHNRLTRDYAAFRKLFPDSKETW